MNNRTGRLLVYLLLLILFHSFASAQVNKKGASLHLLQAMQREGIKHPSFGISSLIDRPFSKVSVKFTHELSAEEISTLETMGVRFHRIQEQVIHFGTIYGAQVPWNVLERLESHDSVLRIESMWLPGRQKPLDVSVPEIQADMLWNQTDTAGLPITGKGVIIADFDTGVDVFHPLFWKADGAVYSWIDVNGNGVFDSGIDAVDLNGNGVKDSGETLRFLDAAIMDSYYTDIHEAGFQADVDWLYNDTNDNGTRDSGKNSGFIETDPTFGEQIFVVEDANKNGKLDVGEHLIALKTSKIIATMNTNSIERKRGENLIDTEPDTNGHGTGVCGILGGGKPGVQKFTGVAPDAELLVANIYWNSDVDWVDYMIWAEDKGARVMLHEIGSWVLEFLDGSSNMETAIDKEAAKGIVQVVPAGNLAEGRRHARSEIAPGQTYDLSFRIPLLQSRIRAVIISLLWRDTAAPLDVSIQKPFGVSRTLAGDDQLKRLGMRAWAWSYHETSSRGTTRFDIALYGGIKGLRPVKEGTWQLHIKNPGNLPLTIDSYIADDATSWSGGVEFLNDVTDDGTIDFPATADSVITVASYSTRGIETEAGGLSYFSSRGKRVDGVSIMDIAAPGNFDVFTALSKDDSYFSQTAVPGSYIEFGGTSAAGPHVAGVAALLLQAFPAAEHNKIKEALQEGTRTDSFTGTCPNDLWGYGKLDAEAAYQWLKDNL